MGKTKQTKEERLRKKREAERRRYARMKKKAEEDPNFSEAMKKAEHEKYLSKRQKKIVKVVGEMTEREKRAKRKQWRENTQSMRKKKRLTMNIVTPPDSEDDESLAVLKRKFKLEKKKAMTAKDRIIAKKDAQIKKLHRKLQKMKTRLSREKNKKENNVEQTPTKRVESLLQSSPTTLRKALLVGEVLKEQLNESFIDISGANSEKTKRTIHKVIRGKILKKYRLTNSLSFLKRGRFHIESRQGNVATAKLKKSIKKFFLEDRNSRLAAGKKESKKGIQLRYLEEDIKRLHKCFIKETNCKVSYTTFTRYRPFWVKKRRVGDRDTCLCVKDENMRLLTSVLKNKRVIDANSLRDVIAMVCCTPQTKECMLRICDVCKSENVKVVSEFNGEENCVYTKWENVNESYLSKKTGKLTVAKKTVKIKKEATLKEMVEEVQSQIYDFSAHLGRRDHQLSALKTQKLDLHANEAVIHMDFSENYSCKLSEEIQSYHFGGSRPQASLHTVVAYYLNEDGSKRTQSFCTISEDLSHEVPAIWAHLKPVIYQLPANVNTIHFWSDSPSAQYRNRHMFHFLLEKFVSGFPQIPHFSWNYLEAGHGKGAPDGVGGLCKRTADNLVGQGTDIPNVQTFIEVLKNAKMKTIIEEITSTAINEMKVHFLEKTKAFPGTMTVHQIRKFPNFLEMRTISCLECEDSCSHYAIGRYLQLTKEKLKVSDVYSSSVEDSGSEDEGVADDSEKNVPITEEKPTVFTVGLWVVVEFEVLHKSNKKMRYYVGQITNIERTGIRVNFLRKRGYTFIYPNVKDRILVGAEQVKMILPVSKMKRNIPVFSKWQQILKKLGSTNVF